MAASIGGSSGKGGEIDITGQRVAVLDGGLSTLDAADLSPDHAVPLEPLFAERIEILRGPATLLYGSSASGGVVNVIDSRIPEILQDDATPENLSRALGNWIRHKDAAKALRERFAAIHASLAVNNGERVREALRPFLTRTSSAPSKA